ncbi:cytochrome b5 [Sparassis latifolia]|uniref:Cytochrome b5 n=1 Tax=Sparassis crispa TaxID=139825 RepID=A0A401H0K3_9APHY|nr:cytochrome b5 [Sparassis crispa]GBE87920.1 cytochrome b5 [Sparassis crispa]
MASYLRSWLYAQTPSDVPNTPSIVESAPHDSDGDTETIHGGDDTDDMPPSFPSVNSAQRIASDKFTENGIPMILTDTQPMLPPPPPLLAQRQPGISSGSLAVPLTTIKPPAKSSKRGKVALAPGHGPLDWANLKKSGQDLRGVDTFLRVTPSMLRRHNKREDAWAVFNGKVYNITPYLSYHPGGERELMRVAGRDGSKLFALTHAWVNLDYMLDGCMVGFLTAEPSS